MCQSAWGPDADRLVKSLHPSTASTSLSSRLAALANCARIRSRNKPGRLVFFKRFVQIDFDPHHRSFRRRRCPDRTRCILFIEPDPNSTVSIRHGTRIRSYEDSISLNDFFLIPASFFTAMRRKLGQHVRDSPEQLQQRHVPGLLLISRQCSPFGVLTEIGLGRHRGADPCVPFDRF